MAEENDNPEDFLGVEPTEKQLLAAIYGIVHQLEQKLDRLAARVEALDRRGNRPP
jgi:hypothetical protein